MSVVCSIENMTYNSQGLRTTMLDTVVGLPVAYELCKVAQLLMHSCVAQISAI